MCGRYTLAHTTAELLKRFEAECDAVDFDPSYNIAPTDQVPVVIALRAGEESAKRELSLVKWGLIPFWVKDLQKMKPLINARSETLMEKPSFKGAFKSKRCIIPADGFFEWKKIGGKKVPMRIKMKSGELFGFAGIYDDWKAPDGSKVRTCAIITVPANEMMQDIHERMPAILSPEGERAWLNPSENDLARLSTMLVPLAHNHLEAYAVSSKVNSPSLKTVECIESISS